MTSQNKSRLDALLAMSGDIPEEVGQVPAELEIRAPRGCLPAEKAGTKHGWHAQDVVQIPTSLTCNLCPHYHVKKRDRRHPLSCPEGRKNQTCPILIQHQQRWALGLIAEIEEVIGQPPTPSDCARIEQIIRHRSRIFQIENYLKVAGLIDLQKGEVRNVADRLTTTEHSLSRTLTEFRQAIADRRDHNAATGPRLEDYLKRIETAEEEPDDGQSKEGK